MADRGSVVVGSVVTNRNTAYVTGIFWHMRKTNMAWTTPTLVEICIGLEINGYLPAEF